MDALSDVLRAVRLAGAVFFDIRASAPWVAETPAGSSIVARIFPDSEHLIPYHVVTSGSCWVAVIGEQSMRLSAGDIVVFPHGHAHVMSSAPGMRSSPDMSRFRRPTDGRLPFNITMGDTSPEPTHLVCGYLGCDTRPYNPLLAALPSLIRVSDKAGGALRAYVQLAQAESKDPRIGDDAVLGRLSELMFVEVVRRYLETLPADRTDWLAGLRDPSIGRAITALHRSPARDWTLQSLAREVGVSRSVLAERFTQFVGRPPMQYLTNWRIQLAANELLGGTDNVAVVANRVGYESEAAFSRAFKKLVGEPPSAWRKRRSRHVQHAAVAAR
jgi:AraC-like DNA-binding protein